MSTMTIEVSAGWAHPHDRLADFAVECSCGCSCGCSQLVKMKPSAAREVMDEDGLIHSANPCRACDWTNHAHHTKPVASCHLCRQFASFVGSCRELLAREGVEVERCPVCGYLQSRCICPKFGGLRTWLEAERKPTLACKGGAWGNPEACLLHEGLPIGADGLCIEGRGGRGGAQ